MNSLADLAEVVDVVIGVDTHVHTHSAAAVNATTGTASDILRFRQPSAAPPGALSASRASAQSAPRADQLRLPLTVRKVGITLLGIGLGAQLLPTLAWTVTNLLELYSSDWYEPVGKFLNVFDSLAGILLFVGFVIFVLGDRTNASGGVQASQAQLRPYTSVPLSSSQPPPAMQTPQGRLEGLQAMLDRGELTSEEHAKQRARVLDSL